MAPPLSWRSLAVFVSSTFRDLDAERDALTRTVFPELRERLRARRCDLVGIDLRWGVDTTAFGAGEDKEAEVLAVCLREIDRSRPFFVILLGDRYGWVPPAERMAGAAAASPAQPEPGAWSVTHLEIEHGALAEGVDAGRAVCLIREPLAYDEVSPEVAARYSDEHATDPGAGDRARRLGALKARLRRELGERCAPYPASWDGDRLRVDDGFTTTATELLWSILDEATSDRAGPVTGSWLDDERLAIDAHLAERGRHLLGRDAELTELEAFVRDRTGPAGRLVLGRAGIGKSAVVAGLVERLRDGDGSRPRVLVHVAGRTPRSGSIRDLLHRWCDDLGAGPLDEAASLDELRARFAESLAAAAAAGPVVLVLDALDQLEDSSAVKRLFWLPDPLPDPVKVVASSRPGADADGLADRRGWTTSTVGPLAPAAAREVVAAIAARRGRRVPDPVMAAIVDPVTRSGGANPLWLTLVAGEVLELGSDDYADLSRHDGDAETQLVGLLVDLVEGLPREVPALYQALYERAAGWHGAAFAPAVLELLATSRAGLREDDLAELVPPLTGEPWSPLRFARFRRHLQAHLVEQEDGRWDFTHEQGREAIHLDEDERRSIHSRIADHLVRLPADDILARRELAHHRIEAGDRRRIVDLLMQVADGDEQAVVDALAGALSRRAATGAQPAVAWLSGLLATEALTTEERRRIAAAALATDDALNGRLAVEHRRSLLDLVVDEVSTANVPADVDSVRLLVSLRLGAGDLALAQGDVSAARWRYAEAVSLAEQFVAALTVLVEEWVCPHCGDPVIVEPAPGSEAIPVVVDHLRRHGDDTAAEWVRTAGAFDLELGPHEDLARAHDRAGDLDLRAGELVAARHHHAEAVSRRREVHRLLVGSDLTFLPDTVVAEVRGDAERLDAAVALAGSLRSLGQIEALDGDPAAGHRSLLEAITVLGDVEGDDASGTVTSALAATHTEAARLALTMGDLAGARAHHEEAVRRSVALHRDQPDSIWRARQLLTDLTQQLSTLLTAGDLAGATTAAAEADVVARTIGRQALDDVETAGVLAEAQLWLADVERLSGDPSSARRRLLDLDAQAAHLAARLEDPTLFATARAACLQRLADLASWAGDGTAARDHLLGAEAVLESAMAHRADDEARSRLAQVGLRLGHLATEPAPDDVARVRRAHQLLLDIAERRPGDLTAQLWSGRAHVLLAELTRDDEPDRAEELLVQGRDRLEALREQIPDSNEVLHALVQLHTVAGSSAWASGDGGAARREMESALAIRQQQHEASPGDVSLVHDLAVAHHRVGIVARDSDRVGAREHLEAARALLAGLVAAEPNPHLRAVLDQVEADLAAT